MAPIGKGILAWSKLNFGPLSALQAGIEEMGLDWVSVRMAYAANPKEATFTEAEMRELIAFCKPRNIDLYGWHYVIGGIWLDKSNNIHQGPYSPENEADYAVDYCKRFNLRGYMIDAEREYKVSDPAGRARRFMTRLTNRMHNEAKDVEIALCSYRYPKLHPQFPFAEFLARCDFNAPQNYWTEGIAPAVDLAASKIQNDAVRKLPLSPVLRVYAGNAHTGPTPAELTAAMSACVSLGHTSFSFWSFDQVWKFYPELRAAIRDFKFPDGTPDQPPVVVPPPALSLESLHKELQQAQSEIDYLQDIARSKGWDV